MPGPERKPETRERTAVVIGASGGIGSALVAALSRDPAVDRIIAAARRPVEPTAAKVEPMLVDLLDEDSIATLADALSPAMSLETVIVATGLLHDGAALQPEKRLADIDPEQLARMFAVNATGPALVAKHFLPLLARSRRSRFAAISARVGSISDNRLGGWYAYRASKAALNMLIRTAAIELKRTNPDAVCLALHPGTVATGLSGPFRSRVAPDSLFTPERAAGHLLSVIRDADPSQSGRCLAWDGTEIEP
ncbi:MAG TPA: SDR family NAD(P)-dependent oxidoreductase [Gammaproteobacteria bacterium]